MSSGPVTHSLVRALGNVPAFAGVDEETLCSIVGCSSNLVWRAGSTVFDAGEPSEALYVVLSGSIRITDRSDAEVVRLGAGDFFGEQSLVRKENHSKRAVAVEDSELMVLPKQMLDQLLAEDAKLAEAISERLEVTESAL